MAGGLGATVRAGIKGEVGVEITVPIGGVPVPLVIPVLGLEAGLMGFGRATHIVNRTVGGSLSGSLSGFSLNIGEAVEGGFAFDYGLSGYGDIQLLGQSVCTLFYPFLEGHSDLTYFSGISGSLDVNSSGISMGLSVLMPQINAFPFEDLPLALGREIEFEDDCPLCDALDALGLLPSYFGGDEASFWTGHPENFTWANGPLSDVYKRAPKITSGAQCRGACGPDCETCNEEKERIECVELPNGKHQFWLYRRYADCAWHQGCKDHDACYDWCSETGGGGILGTLISIPCRRWCDFESVCEYSFKQSVGWARGRPPHQGRMAFSDKPELLGECEGPCEEQEGADGQTEYRICLPNEITLFDRRSETAYLELPSIGEHTLFTKGIEVPYLGLGLNLIRIYAFADFLPKPFVRGEIGPAYLRNVCVIFNPQTKAYRGTAEIGLDGQLTGQISLRGGLGAAAGEGKISRCLRISILDAEGALTATGRVEVPISLRDNIEVGCEQGQVMMNNTVSLETALRLSYSLNASLEASVLGFTVYENVWPIDRGVWEKEWNTILGVVPISLGSGAALPSLRALPDLDLGGINGTELLSWLLPDISQNDSAPEVKAVEANATHGVGDGENAGGGNGDNGGNGDDGGDDGNGGSDPCGNEGDQNRENPCANRFGRNDFFTGGNRGVVWDTDMVQIKLPPLGTEFNVPEPAVEPQIWDFGKTYRVFAQVRRRGGGGGGSSRWAMRVVNWYGANRAGNTEVDNIGHIIGQQFGGPANSLQPGNRNFFPQDRDENTRLSNEFEHIITRALDGWLDDDLNRSRRRRGRSSTNRACIEVIIDWPSDKTLRPTSMTVHWWWQK